MFRGTLLVVMPNGFGVARVGAPTGRGSGRRRSAGRAGAAAPPGALGGAAIAAVQRLAAAAGHRLLAPRSAASGRTSAHSATGVVAWLAFAVGAILIAAAWTISLRLRPPRRRDGVASPHGS